MMKIQNKNVSGVLEYFFVWLSEEISFVSVVLTCTETASLFRTEKEARLTTDSSRNE